MKDFDLEKTTKNLGVSYIILVVIGFINLVLYYISFNIPIYEYLTISEVFITSFRLLLVMSIPLAFSLILIWKTISESINKKNKFINLRILHRKVFQYSAVISLLMVVCLTLFAKGFFKNTMILGFSLESIPIYIINFVTITFLTIMVLVNLIMSEEAGSLFDEIIPSILFWIFPVLLFIASIFSQSYIIKNIDSPVTSTFFLANDSIVTTNDSIKYIGKTESYYFIWHKNSKTSTIYPSSEIKRIEIKTNNITPFKHN